MNFKQGKEPCQSLRSQIHLNLGELQQKSQKKSQLFFGRGMVTGHIILKACFLVPLSRRPKRIYVLVVFEHLLLQRDDTYYTTTTYNTTFQRWGLRKWHYQIKIFKSLLKYFFLPLQTSHHHRPAADLTKALKMLNNSETTLKWSDFLLIDEAGFMSTKAGTFYSATYSATKTPVTLLVSPAPVSPTDILPDTSSPSSSSHKTDAFSLSPVSKFISEDASAEFMSSTPADKGILTLL